MSWQKVCAVNELNPGSAKAVELSTAQGTVTIAVVRDTAGGWHAIDDLCPHADVSLSEGDVDECTIECWGHGAKVNINSGEGSLPITTAVNVYEIKIDGENVLVNPILGEKE